MIMSNFEIIASVSKSQNPKHQNSIIFFAAYLGDSLRPAPMAGLSNVDGIESHCYEQFLWKSLRRLKIKCPKF